MSALVIELSAITWYIRGQGGGSKSINHTSMHRVKHEEMNESSAHGVPLPSGDRLSQSSGALTHETCGVIKPTQLPSGDCLSQP